MFNCASFIEEALDSIETQSTKQSLEISICDDGSSDGGLDIVRSWQKKSKRVAVILSSNKTNLGPGESRNLAVQQSSGEFLAMLDADDVMLPERLEKQLAAWRAVPEPDAAIVGCHLGRIPTDSTPRYQVCSAIFHAISYAMCGCCLHICDGLILYRCLKSAITLDAPTRVCVFVKEIR